MIKKQEFQIFIKSPHSIRTWYRVYTSSDVSSEKKKNPGSLSLVEYQFL